MKQNSNTAEYHYQISLRSIASNPQSLNVKFMGASENINGQSNIAGLLPAWRSERGRFKKTRRAFLCLDIPR